MSFTRPPNDPLFGQSWHLSNTGQGGGTAGMDIRALSAWTKYIGRNILVAVADDGVELTHPDLAGNAWARPAGTTLVDAGNANLVTGAAVTPGTGGAGDNHGTSVAGVIAASGNNALGSLGVAPGAKLVAYRILGQGSASSGDAFQQALNDGVAVINNSWGNDTAFNTPGAATLANQVKLATEGRGGLGTIVVWAQGNERGSTVGGQNLTGTDGGLDAATANRFTIAVAAVDNNGVVTEYSTRGANLLISTPGGVGDPRLQNGNGIVAVDRVGPANGYNDQDSPAGDYTGFNGTSAAAPVLSGIVALMLEANPRLGYRDVQEILAYTARQVDFGAGTGDAATMNRTPWVGTQAGNANGGGLKFSTDYGFGLADAGAAVRLAETWTAQKTEANLITGTANAAATGVITAGGQPAAQVFTTTFNMAQAAGALAGFRVNRIELDLGITAPRPQDLTIDLTSPGGTKITMARTPGNAFVKGEGNSYDPNQPIAWPEAGFTLNSPGFWGENAVGAWKLDVTAAANAANASSVTSAVLKVYGDAASGPDLRSWDIVTDDFARLAAAEAGRTVLGAGGKTGINAAAMTADVTIDLRANDGAGAGQSKLGAQVITFAGNTVKDAWGGAGADKLFGDSGANRLFGGWGNDELQGGAGNDELDGGDGFDVAVYALAGPGDIVIRQIAGGALSVQVSLAAEAGTDTLRNIEAIRTTNATVTLGDGLTGLFRATLPGNDNVLMLGTAYSGPVNYLQRQLLGTAGNDIYGGTAGNDFINALGGDDAVNAGAGDDVIDGGTGSNFLTGGPGRDVFFLDGRGGTITWSTITDWEKGEELSVWGWRPGVSKSTWVASDGVAGWKGVTLHMDLDGDGRIDTSVTWTGKTQADLPTPKEFVAEQLLWFV
jgi:subtilisin family serine protease